MGRKMAGSRVSELVRSRPCPLLYAGFLVRQKKEQMDRLFRNSGLFRESGIRYIMQVEQHMGRRHWIRPLKSQRTYTAAKASQLSLNSEGGIYRTRGESVYPITNFIIQPVEMIVSEDETQMTA